MRSHEELENALALDVPDVASGNVSPRAGSEAGEDMMQDFVRLHMMSILQPFAERCNELQHQVQQLAVELQEVNASHARHNSVIDEHVQQLSTMQAVSVETVKSLEALQVDAAAAKRERNRLEGNHEMTKATLVKAKERIEAISSSACSLQESLQDCSSKRISLESAVTSMEKRIMDEMELRLNKQGRACKDLVERQAEITKACEQAKMLAEKANAALRKLSNEHESCKQEDARRLSLLEECTTGFEAKLATADSEIKRHSDQEKCVERELQHLKTWTAQLKDIGQIHERQREVRTIIDTQACRLEQTEASIVEFKEEVMRQRQVQNSELNCLEVTINKNVADTARLMETQKAHVDLISSASQRLQDLEISQGSLTTVTDTLRAEVQSLASWQGHAVKDLEGQCSTLTEVQRSMCKAHEGLADITGNVNELRAVVGVESESLKKLGTRVDQCYKYFNGLGKGLQETHRQILNTESNMLPQKLGGSAMLPTLPTMPRTPRGSLPTPRKATAT